MKIIIRLSLLLVFFSNVCFSQQLKEKKQRRYNPYVAGVSSALLSGLGQVYCGEVKRGFLFLGGSALGWGLLIKGSKDLYGGSKDEPNGHFLAGVLVYSLVKKWSIVDAVLQANKKNKENVAFRITPNLVRDAAGNNNLAMNLSIRF